VSQPVSKPATSVSQRVCHNQCPNPPHECVTTSVSQPVSKPSPHQQMLSKCLLILHQFSLYPIILGPSVYQQASANTQVSANTKALGVLACTCMQLGPRRAVHTAHLAYPDAHALQLAHEWHTSGTPMAHLCSAFHHAPRLCRRGCRGHRHDRHDRLT